MTILSHLTGIKSRMVQTDRGSFHILEFGKPGGQGHPLLFVHGNMSSSTFWEELMRYIPNNSWAIAPDLRGYGESERLPIDATRGMRDLSDDIQSLAVALQLDTFHLIGHSMGGCVAMQYTIDHPQKVTTLTLVATGSPYGFGGTKDIHGTPCYPDYAGSGGGLIHPEVIRRIAEQDRSDESDFSPRRLLNNRMFKPPYRSPREDVLVEAMVMMSTDVGTYSRDMLPSANWPNIAPGTQGINNALSPKYCQLTALAEIAPKPPILWIRGADDHVVTDRSASDPGTLGQLGILPGWPGAEVYPPQPMVSQIRTLLERYQTNGGTFREYVLANAGHIPYMEEPNMFKAIWLPFLH